MLKTSTKNTQLYLIPTPIGNLEDITLRALRTIKEIDLLLAEDTRQTNKLLKHYDISVSMHSFHSHNEHKTVDSIIDKLKSGLRIGLVSDAGTPGISDPGFLLITKAMEAGIECEVLPGANAFVPALIKSGLPNHNFVFEGFLPVKKGRQTKLKELVSETRTMIFYESPYKILKTLKDLEVHFGNRKASVSRELTKLFEETINGSLEELIVHFEQNNVKGEMVLVVEGSC